MGEASLQAGGKRTLKVVPGRHFEGRCGPRGHFQGFLTPFLPSTYFPIDICTAVMSPSISEDVEGWLLSAVMSGGLRIRLHNGKNSAVRPRSDRITRYLAFKVAVRYARIPRVGSEQDS